MNPVLLLVRDNFDMNKRCIDSIFAQDIPTTLVIIDNSERDDTVKWAMDNRISVYPFRPQIGVSRGWNLGLSALFRDGASHVLVPNSDTIIPKWFYRRLLNCHVGFVTGISVGTLEEISEEPPEKEFAECPDFSGFLISHWVWNKVGNFQESMVHYASDNAWHIEAHRNGVKLWNAGIPFFHERSSTLNLSSPKEKRTIQLQADADREVFKSIYGCYPWEPGYAELFK